MDRITELRTALGEQVKAQDLAIDAVKTVDGVLDITAEVKAEFDARMANIREIKGLLAIEEEVKSARDYLAAPSSAPVGFGADQGGQVATQQSRKSVADLFLASDQWKAFKGSGKMVMDDSFELKIADLAGYAMKDVYRAIPSGTPGDFGSIQRDALVERQHRAMRIRDLFGVLSTEAAVIEFFRVTGFTNGASVVGERATGNTAFALKPQSSLTFVGTQQTTKTIAHYEVAHRNTLNDESQLRGIIDSELLYGLQLVEDAQILSGDQTVNTEDLPGILNDAGIQTYAQSSGPSTDNNADAIRRALTKTYLSFFDPTGVVVHPSDWETMELIKSTTGEYLLSVSIATGGVAKVWNVPVVQTSAIAAKTALVGAFGMGAQLYDREQANIRVAEQHSDYFLRNAVAILAEERLALCMKRPEAFVKVTLS